MGRTKELLIEQAEKDRLEAEITEFINTQLSKEGIINEILSGISKQLIGRGLHSLSKKQRAIIDNYINEYKNNHKCEVCLGGNMSYLSDYLHVEESEYNLCPMCEYDRAKIMQD
ncbi:MAG: hypothetical protein R3Y22_09900 [Bacteroidales bacterium]